MNNILPVVRQMILCDKIAPDPNQPRKVSAHGLVTNIYSTSDPPYPMVYKELCVYVVLTGCRGQGVGWLQVRHAVSGRPIFHTPAQPLRLPSDPLMVIGRVFRARDCRFPEPGDYEVEFWYDGTVLHQVPVLLR